MRGGAQKVTVHRVSRFMRGNADDLIIAGMLSLRRSSAMLDVLEKRSAARLMSFAAGSEQSMKPALIPYPYRQRALPGGQSSRAFDDLSPAKGIAVGLLISLGFWLGAGWLLLQG
jgi:hypothetical protein